ncbi:MAG: RNA-binding protein [Bacteroidia bacterium]
MNIYVGNIPYTIDEDGLEQLFSAYGTVTSAKIIIDRETGRSKGFGFVEMSDDQEGQDAIDNLNQHELDGRALKVNEARPNNNSRGGGRGGFNRGGGGGGYNRGGGGGGGYGRNRY